MNFVVTGSEGFIGKELVNALESNGHNVTKVDVKLGTDASYIDSVVDWSKHVDCVFHLAAQTSVFNKNVFGIERDNIYAFMKVVQCCNDNNTKLVYASSSTANIKNITSMYGMTKMFNEMYANVYAKNATGVRFHNVYGKNPREGTLLYVLKNNEHVKLWNNGENYRHFTYVDDIVDGLVYAYNSDEKVLNCCNGQRSSVLEFCDIAKKYLHFEYEKSEEIRELDKVEQSVDFAIPTIMLKYKSIEDGLKMSLL